MSTAPFRVSHSFSRARYKVKGQKSIAPGFDMINRPDNIARNKRGLQFIFRR